MRTRITANLLGRDGNLTRLNLGSHGLGRHSVDGAAHRVASTQNFLDSTRQVTSQRLVANLAGNINHSLQRQVTVVLNVLLLLAVTGWLLQGLDDHAGSGRQDLDRGSAVLHGQLDADAQASVFGGGLDNVIVDLLGGDTEGTNLLGKGRTSTFLTDGADVDYILWLVWMGWGWMDRVVLTLTSFGSNLGGIAYTLVRRAPVDCILLV